MQNRQLLCSITVVLQACIGLTRSNRQKDGPNWKQHIEVCRDLLLKGSGILCLAAGHAEEVGVDGLEERN